MEKKLQVFISSTFLDLKDERQAAVQAILKSGHIPAGMELFTAGDKSQMETIKRWINESDIYMLILGGRYGSVEPTTSLSYTELEYDYAREQGKPLFAVVITDAALNNKVKALGIDVMEREHPAELKLFKEKVLNNISSFFEDTKDIKLSVHETISDFIGRYKFSGWVHGRDVPDTSPLLDEIKRLSARNSELENDLLELQRTLEKNSKNQFQDGNFEKLITILDSIKVSTKLFNDEDVSMEYSLLHLFIILTDQIVAGVTNQFGSSNLQSFLYFNVCTKLQIHGLVKKEKVAGVQWQRFSITSKGEQFLAYMDHKKMTNSQLK